MGWNQGSRRPERTVSKHETKVCPLCGALNFHRNAECFTCGWHGRFECDQAAIDYQWQSLTERYEEVRLEHLIARGGVVGDFGVVRRAAPWQRWRAALVCRWNEFLARRDARYAQREAGLRPKPALPPK